MCVFIPILKIFKIKTVFLKLFWIYNLKPGKRRVRAYIALVTFVIKQLTSLAWAASLNLPPSRKTTLIERKARTKLELWAAIRKGP